MSQSSEKLLATLHREKPSRMTAYVGGDEDGRSVAIRGGRKKWSQTVAAVEGLGAWTRVELLDKTGALLATVENMDPAGELQDLTGRGGVWEQVERGMAIVQRAVEAAAKSRGEEMRTVLQAQTDLMRETTVAVKTLSALHQSHLETVRAASQAQLEATVASSQQADSEDEMGQLMQALPQILQLLPLLKGMTGGGGGAPPNGTAH